MSRKMRLFISNGALPVEVMHGIACIAGDLVQAPATLDCFLNGILITIHLIVWRGREREREIIDQSTRLQIYFTISSVVKSTIQLPRINLGRSCLVAY